MFNRWLARRIWGYARVTPSHPGRGLVLKLADRLDPAGLVDEVAPGVKFRLHLGDPTDLAYWQGKYEADDDVGAFVSLLRPGMTVVDVGANYGLYTLLSARAVGPTGRVFAFEAMPNVYERLAEHVRLTGADNVRTHQLAVCDRVGTATFLVGVNVSQGSLVRGTTDRTIEVRTTSLDHHMADAGVERVDAVKADVEGAEMLIVRGMHRLLSGPHQPVILLEHNYNALAKAGSSAAELFDTVVGYGYVPFLVEQGRLVRVDRLAPTKQAGEEAYNNYIYLPPDHRLVTT